MTPDELFQAALQLAGTPWRVARSDFSGKPPILEIVLEFVRGSQFHCPQCGQLCGVHDTMQKRWRHLNFFQYRCELVANVPRVWCQQDGVHLINELPWASAALVISSAGSPREPSKQLMASSSWLNGGPADSATSPIYAPSLTGSLLNSKSLFLPYYPLETARRQIC